MVSVQPLFELDPARVKETITSIEEWIRQWFAGNGGQTAVLGMSGGKDSTVCAKLLVEALGSENVVGVFMPNGIQADYQDALDAAEAAGLTRTQVFNIGFAYDRMAEQLPGFSRESQAGINLAPHLRMSALYMVSQGLPGGRVCCTGNLSEATVGYCTLYGDLAGDFAPLLEIFKEDVCEIGKALGLPGRLVDKVPADGLSGKSDEEKLGFSYADIREYCRSGYVKLPSEVYGRISRMADRNRFKGRLVQIPRWSPRWDPGLGWCL